MTRRRRRFLLPLPMVAVAALLLPLPHEGGTPSSAGEAAYHSLPAKPAGDPDRGRAGVERSAIGLADWLRAIPLAEDDGTPCPTDRLEVAWHAPADLGPHGAYVGTLGPAPTEATLAVNGIVVCREAPWAFMGFQARWAGHAWDVVATPILDAGEQDLPEVTEPEPEPQAATPSAPVISVDGRTFGAAIEGLAAYEPQRTCDGTAKPGTAALRNLLLKDSPGSRNLGIVRGCSVGGQSEHKEGRAFDWGVNVGRPAEKAQADAFVSKLLATDEHGNRYALARRMGVMYVIWNQQIWSAYRASEGWRPYHGASPHTDHVHISLSWAGAQARTSFWSGNVVEVLLASAPTGAGGAGRTAIASARPAPSTRRPRTTVTTDAAAAERRRAEWQARRAEADAQRRAAAEQSAADRAARRAQARADAEADAEARAQQDAERRQRRTEEAEARAKAEAERRAAEQAARRAELERRQAEWQARHQPTTATTAPHRTTSTTAAPATTTTTAAPPSTTSTTAEG